jgi:hypothetical protein
MCHKTTSQPAPDARRRWIGSVCRSPRNFHKTCRHCARRGLALWITIPPALNQWIKTQLGWGFVVLTPLAVIGLFFLAVRPALWTTAGQGTGHFVLARSTASSRRKPWMTLLSIVGFATCYWATPQDHRLTVWAAGFGFAALGCLLAVAWRIRTEQELRRPAP